MEPKSTLTKGVKADQQIFKNKAYKHKNVIKGC
jgi:hypothetical protein